MKRIWDRYSLGIVLTALFLGSWVAQGFVGWQEFKADQSEHQQVAQVFGADGYIWNFGQATLENWQSEFLQLLTFVVLTAYLLYRGSPESKDSDEEMQSALQRIERRLDELTPAGGRRAG